MFASRIPYPVPRIPHPVPRIPYPVSRIPYPVSRIPHPASRIPNPASRIPYPASRIPHPVPRMTDHSKIADKFVADIDRAHWHDGALWFVRQKRDKAAADVPEWEQLRDLAAQIKTHTIANLAHYLEDFERNATRLGAKVHWARDAAEHNQIVHGILEEHDVTRVVKSKSMLTEECHLNPYLNRQGIEVIDTDLGEWIVQLRNEPPSHIVLPAIHIKKEDVGELFHEKIGTDAGESDPTTLTERLHACTAEPLPAGRGWHHRRQFCNRRNRRLCRLHQ